MALAYKHRVTGRTVQVLEPNELVEKLRTVERRGRRLDESRLKLAKKRRERTLRKMDDAWKWQRVDGGDQAEAGNGEEPSDADVRSWAKAEGIEVSTRGKLPAELVERYKARES